MERPPLEPLRMEPCRVDRGAAPVPARGMDARHQRQSSTRPGQICATTVRPALP